MKRLLYSILAMAVLVSVAVVWENGFQSQLHALMDLSQQGMEEMEQKEYAKALHTVETLSDRFEVLEEEWTIVINHNLLDEVSNAATEVKALLIQEEYSHAAAQLTVLKTLFKDLDDHFKFSLGNIF